MSDADLPMPPRATTFFDRLTRRVGRASALVLGLSVLIPRFGFPPEGGVRLHWLWQREARDDHFPDEQIARLLLWLALAGVAWWAAARQPLLRRGRWLTLAPAACLAVLSSARPFTVGDRSIVWPLGWPLLPLLLASLGLVLISTVAHRRLGRALCAFGGALLLGLAFFPVHEEFWLGWWKFLVPDVGERVQRWDQVVLLLWLALGPLLLWIGLARRYPRRAPALVACVLALAVGTGIVSSQLNWLELGRRARPWWQDTLVVVNGLRHDMRSWSLALLLASGLLAWIVGGRQHRDWSVFD